MKSMGFTDVYKLLIWFADTNPILAIYYVALTKFLALIYFFDSKDSLPKKLFVFKMGLYSKQLENLFYQRNWNLWQ